MDRYCQLPAVPAVMHRLSRVNFIQPEWPNQQTERVRCLQQPVLYELDVLLLDYTQDERLLQQLDEKDRHAQRSYDRFDVLPS